VGRHTNGIKLTKEQFLAKLPDGDVTAEELMVILKLKSVERASDIIAVAGADDREELWAAIAGSHPHVYLYPDTGDVVTPQHLRAFVQYLESGKTSPWSAPKERVRRAQRVSTSAPPPQRKRKSRPAPAPATPTESTEELPIAAVVKPAPVVRSAPPPKARSPPHPNAVREKTTIVHPPPVLGEPEVNLLATERSALPGAKHVSDCDS